MASITHSRVVSASPAAVERAITDDLAAFLAAGGYDSVTVEGDRVEIERQLGLATLSLVLRPREDADAALAFEQESGHFEELTMEYTVGPAPEGAELTGRTEFSLGGVVGNVLDETLVRRQRTKELNSQFDYVEEAVRD